MDGSANPAPQPAIARFPVSTAQRQMWFVDHLSPGDATLNVAVRWRVLGPVRTASLESALQWIVDRHEILRTRFVLRDGEPVQEVVDHVPARLGVVDLRGVPEAQHAARLDEIGLEDAARPYDLTQPGLFRATLVRLAPESAVVLFGAHHIVFDGTSIGVMGHEFGTAAAAFDAGEAPDLPDLPLQYGDYALWQRDLLASGVEEEDAAYWKDRLQGAAPFEIVPDKPRPALRTTAIARVGRDLPDTLMAGLQARAQAAQVSLFTLGAAVAGAVLARVAGRDDVLMSTPIAGRTEVELEPLIGPFINHHVLRLPAQAGTALDDHLGAARKAVEEALAHQALPFSRLVEILNPPRDLSRTPFTGVGFNLIQAFHRDARYGGFDLLSAPAFASGSAQDLSVLLVGRASQPWRLSVEYNPDLYEAATAEALLDALAAALQAVAGDKAARLADLPLPTALAARGTGAPRPFAAIEEVLAGHGDVAAAAAVPAPGGSGGYAFVSARPDCLVPLETLPDELMAHAARRLPPEERPVGISVLASLPRTASGDLDRARLPRPVVAAPPRPFVPETPAPVAPRPPAPAARGDDIADTLAAIWAELLDRAEVPHDAGFFDLGGHSLLAVRLMARIRERWGVALGVAALYQAPTIEGLAARIVAEVAPGAAAGLATEDDWQIEPILTEGDAQPIVAVNDVGLILDTAQHLSARHPATCVRLFDGTRGIDRSPRSFEEIAAQYAATIRRAQPEGPYLLFGVCVHGNIALEAARILQAEGAEITGVVLKDVWEPGYAAGLRARRATRWAERLYALGNRVRMVRMGTMSLAALLGSYRILRRLGVPQAARALGLIERVQASDLAPEQERFVSYISAARNVYRPAPVDFPVLHVVTKITAQGRLFLPSIGWEKVVPPGRLTTVRLDEVVVTRGLRIGTAELAREIDGWLSRGGTARG